LVDQGSHLRNLSPDPEEQIDAALRAKAGGETEAGASPLTDLARAQTVYQGCNVLRHFVDKAARGDGLTTSERYFVADVLGRLGSEAEPSLQRVLRYLSDFRPGMASRLLARLYPHPTSCARIRQKMPELTARVGCDCRFRLVPGAYPTPALHAAGAAEIPGLAERVRGAASRGGQARSARAEEQREREEVGARAAALCTRLSDLRRQARAVDRTVTTIEGQLDRLLEDAGADHLDTPSGRLRRVIENGVRRFVIEV
jgi:hypothetical protein